MIIEENKKKTIYDYDFIVSGLDINTKQKAHLGLCRECLEIFIKEAQELLKGEKK